MPSKSRTASHSAHLGTATRSRSSHPQKAKHGVLPKLSQREAHLFFTPVLFLSLVVWIVYRMVFKFPVWFDETVGKAIFFGLPVWLYVTVTRSMSVPNTFSLDKLKRGLLLGVAVGGIFGFAASLISAARPGVVVESAMLFSSDEFWWEFFLALCTGFWETLFFFSFVMVVIQEKYKNWALIRQVLVVALIFLVFHVPNMILRFATPQAVLFQVFLMTFFAIGQALLFSREQNSYALTLSHAIWGMVLLVHLT